MVYSCSPSVRVSLRLTQSEDTVCNSRVPFSVVSTVARTLEIVSLNRSCIWSTSSGDASLTSDSEPELSEGEGGE